MDKSKLSTNIRTAKSITFNCKIYNPSAAVYIRLTNNTISWATAVNVPGAYIINYSVYSEGKQIATLSREIEVI